VVQPSDAKQFQLNTWAAATTKGVPPNTNPAPSGGLSDSQRDAFVIGGILIAGYSYYLYCQRHKEKPAS
jgi:hypothetical protein